MWTEPVNQSLGPGAVWPPLWVNFTGRSFLAGGAVFVVEVVQEASAAVTVAVMSPAMAAGEKRPSSSRRPRMTMPV